MTEGDLKLVLVHCRAAFDIGRLRVLEEFVLGQVHDELAGLVRGELLA